MSLNHNAMLEWDNKSGRYMPGWYIGSEGDNGEHMRTPSLGWPFCIYRQGAEPGVTDMVLCGGIQAFEDAEALANMLNKRLGIFR